MAGVLAHFPRRAGICKLVSRAAPLDTRVQFITAKMSATSGLNALEQKDLHAKKVATTYVMQEERPLRVVSVYLGEEEKLSESALRSGTCTAVQVLKDLKAKVVEFLIPPLASIAPQRAAYVVQQAATLKNYSFFKYITKEEARASLFDSLSVVSAGEPANNSVLETVCNATIFARDLANERADVANPEYLETVARTVAQDTGLGLHVLGMEQLQQQGLNLLAAVGQGSRFAPRLVALEHKGGPADQPPILFVGKGITFDTGGLNLKSTGHIENMHLDMSGAAITLATMQALAQLKAPRNVVGILALAENAIGQNAYKPHAIVQSLKGLTVRVNNTDAEGRLALADALTYGQQRYKPSHIVDIATLTGACVVALGEHAAGLFTNNAALEERLRTLSQEVHERVWPLPILPEHSDSLKGTDCDIVSTGEAGKGGSCTAAAFLKYFVEGEVPWAHLDIAGPGMYSKEHQHFNAGGTGFGVQLLTSFALDPRL